MSTQPTLPAYPAPRDLLRGRTVLVTAAAGTGIGFATAKRALEEGARVFVSDIHERRLAEAVERLRAINPDQVDGKLCDVTRHRHHGPGGRAGEQRRPRRFGCRDRDDG
jgi:3-oxoacyl-[acyl-carrier protein] reductase